MVKLESDTKHAYEIGSFATYFRALVNNGPYSQVEIAQHLGVTTRTITNYLTNVRIPGAVMCEEIAMLFGVSITEVRAAAGKPLPTSIDSVFDRSIRSLILGMDWTPSRLAALKHVLEVMEQKQEAERVKK